MCLSADKTNDNGQATFPSSPANFEIVRGSKDVESLPMAGCMLAARLKPHDEEAQNDLDSIIINI